MFESVVGDEAGSAVLSPPVHALVSAVSAVVGVTPAEVPAAQAVEDLRALLTAREQLDAHLLHRLRDMELRQLHDLDAYPSAATWVEAQGTSADRAMVALGRRIDRLPAVSEAVEAGRLTIAAGQRVGLAVEKVRGFLDRPDGLIDGQPPEETLQAVLVRGVCMMYGEAMAGLADDDPRLRELYAEVLEIVGRPTSQVARVEAAFVALARRLARGLIKPALDQLVEALLPQQLEDRSEEASRLRALALVRNDGRPGWRIEGDLDDETGELAFTALAAAMATDPANPVDTELAAARRAAGEDPYAPGPGPAPRSRLMLRHDAFGAVLRDWLGSGIAGRRGKALTQVTITCGLDTLHGAPGALPAVAGSGARLPVSVVRRLMCDSAITRLVLSLGNRVIEMSHTSRTLKGHERKAKLVETGGRCQAASCARPRGTPLIPHHPDAYARSKTTSFYDTVLLCEGDHNHLHVGGKVLRLRDGRLLGPEGWVPQLRAA